MSAYPDHRDLYRLPWSLPDNPIVWLEPTAACNIYCEGCYRGNVKDGHKPLDTIREELETFARHRNFDGVSIAGGDPLTHPDIVRIVEMVDAMGKKPILNTNGVALSDEMLRELKRAGARGFTFHVDSKQGRPGWSGASEVDLNDLRLELASRLQRVGGLACAFNSTVYEDTLDQTPDVLAWAQRHIDKVHVVVFIAFRQASGEVSDAVDFYVGGEKISTSDLVYSRPTAGRRLDISSRDIVARLRQGFPDFAPCAYLNGTEKADSLKWLLTTRIGTRERIYGYAGPRFMELTQAWQHFAHRRFLAYAPPKVLRRGRAICAATWPIDAGIRRTAARFLGDALLRPWRLARRLHVQSVMIIQPIDILADGRMNMCDSCPDMTVHDGELVWSCRLDERLKYGAFAHAVPRSPGAERLN